tara:strand:- start:227 stop:781 length:555 start_codon:yes stop_codon:yes gene_type:complete
MAKRITFEIFLERSQNVFGDRYDYSKVEFEKVDKKVIIICKEHGEFLMRPRAHYVDRRGCPKCNKTGKSGFSTSKENPWINEPKDIYLVEVVNDNERFLKFGVSVNGVVERLKKGEFPYQYNILFEKRIKDGNKAIELEQKLKEKYHTKIGYKTSLSFRGDTECLDFGIKEHLSKDLTMLTKNL